MRKTNGANLDTALGVDSFASGSHPFSGTCDADKLCIRAGGALLQTGAVSLDPAKQTCATELVSLLNIYHNYTDARSEAKSQHILGSWNHKNLLEAPKG